ncbi:MAG: ABC transporter substrate-binding protein [Methylococcaceae bacterium]
MKAKQYTLFGLFAVLLGFMSVTEVIAAELLPPQQIIQSVSAQLQERLKDKSFTQNFAEVNQFVNGVIDPHTDFAKVAPLVLGKHWKTATTLERQRFTQEFKTLLVRIYSRAFVEYNDWTIRFKPVELPDKATKVIVKTDVLQPGQNPIEVNYRMFLSKGVWKVYDIMIDGVSLVTNYRSTFDNEIQTKGSLSAVIDALAKRNVEMLAAKKS